MKYGRNDAGQLPFVLIEKNPGNTGKALPGCVIVG
jgi:hypothetical protein